MAFKVEQAGRSSFFPNQEDALVSLRRDPGELGVERGREKIENISLLESEEDLGRSAERKGRNRNNILGEELEPNVSKD